MSDSESIEYLQSGFDATTLTIPRLRSILVNYNIHYPSNAKKPELVGLFNTQVAPQASKILARRARAKRSSMGIIDVATASSQDTTVFGDSFDQQPAASTSPRKRRPGRPSSRASATPQPLSQVGEDDVDEDEELLPSRQRRSSPRKRSSRAASLQPADSVATSMAAASDTDTGPEPTIAAAGGRLAVAAAAAARPPSRRARTKTPQVKLEPTEEEAENPFRAAMLAADEEDEREDSVFTDENPFQSGSSPITGPSPSERRRTASHEPTPRPASSRKSLNVAQRRSSPFVTPFVVPEPEPEDEEEEDEEDLLAPGEEFTPEEQLELTQEEAAVRRTSKKIRTTAKTRGAGSALATPLLVLVLTLLGAYGAWYRQEKLAVGFCGLGRPAKPLLSEQLATLEASLEWVPEYVADHVPERVSEWVAEWAPDRLPGWVPDVPAAPEWVHNVEVPSSLQALVEPQCEPCPPHAFCYSDFSVRCENGYLLKQHPLSLGGLVPLAPTCEPDGERARRVKAVADKAIEELRDRRAKWECGDLVDEDGQAADGPAIDVPVLKEVISEKRSKKMSKEEFDDLWTAAIGDIESREEVEAEPEPMYAATDPGSVPTTRLSSTSLARLPLGCAVRRSIRLGVARYRFPLSVLVLAAAALLYARARFRAHRAALARVPGLVDTVLARLAAQKALWLYDDGVDEAAAAAGAGSGTGTGTGDEDDTSFLPDPFLFLPHLRDDVLRATHSLAERERIWKHVRAVVEQNSNVRTGQREGRNGEVGRAWEWIGPVGAAAAAASGLGLGEMSAVRRRRSGRPSYMSTPRDSYGGGSVAATPGEAPAAAPAAAPGEENRSALHKRWQESRPIY